MIIQMLRSISNGKGMPSSAHQIHWKSIHLVKGFFPSMPFVKVFKDFLVKRTNGKKPLNFRHLEFF